MNDLLIDTVFEEMTNISKEPIKMFCIRDFEIKYRKFDIQVGS